VANHLDFLEALDGFVRDSSLGLVQQGGELHGIAQDADLVEPGNEAAARWTGQLVDLGLLKHGLKSMGDPDPYPTGAWLPRDVFRFSDYTVTAAGHAEAETIRRRRRDSFTDAALGGVVPTLIRPWMSDVEKRAVWEPLAALRAALDAERGVAAIGAAKDLVEASCKVVVARAGADIGVNPSLPTLFKVAYRCVAGEDRSTEKLGRSLASTAQGLAELRNAVGPGHDHAMLPEIGVREPRLAASASTGLSAYLLSGWR
jgi:hypothetical protein